MVVGRFRASESGWLELSTLNTSNGTSFGAKPVGKEGLVIASGLNLVF
jgi:hypothetical protein